MSSKALTAATSVIGCRNGLPVVQYTTYQADGTQCIYYSDGLGDLNFIPWSCGWSGWLDYETTCVAENDDLYYLRFDTETNTYLVFDFNGNDVTWTVTPIKCNWGLGIYNEQQIFDITTAFWLPWNSFHSVSIVVLEWTADITVWTTTTTWLPEWFSITYEADTLLVNTISITPSASSRVIVTTLS